VIAAATETPRGKRSHAVSAHVAEGHGAQLVHLDGSGTSSPISSHIKPDETKRFERAFLLARSIFFDGEETANIGAVKTPRRLSSSETSHGAVVSFLHAWFIRWITEFAADALFTSVWFRS
jgi:hypothetical protein